MQLFLLSLKPELHLNLSDFELLQEVVTFCWLVYFAVEIVEEGDDRGVIGNGQVNRRSVRFYKCYTLPRVPDVVFQIS